MTAINDRLIKLVIFLTFLISIEVYIQYCIHTLNRKIKSQLSIRIELRTNHTDHDDVVVHVRYILMDSGKIIMLCHSTNA